MGSSSLGLLRGEKLHRGVIGSLIGLLLVVPDLLTEHTAGQDILSLNGHQIGLRDSPPEHLLTSTAIVLTIALLLLQPMAQA